MTFVLKLATSQHECPGVLPRKNGIQMKHQFAILSIADCVTVTSATASFDAAAQINGSTLSAVLALPLALVLVLVLVLDAATGSAIAVSLVFSAAGAVLVVKAVEVSAQGTLSAL